MLLNTAALLLGYLVYTPIAHGITGAHGSRTLTMEQLAAHSVALVIVALLVGAAQRRALVPAVPVTWARVVTGAAAFTAAFWFGYYLVSLADLDWDILCAFLVLGSWIWMGKVPMKGHAFAAAVALLSFPLASFVAEVILLVAFTLLKITPALQTNEIHHSVFWVTVGGVTGLLGGWMSGLALARMLGMQVGRAQPNYALERTREG